MELHQTAIIYIRVIVKSVAQLDPLLFRMCPDLLSPLRMAVSRRRRLR
jgi:hypothetical protein